MQAFCDRGCSRIQLLSCVDDTLEVGSLQRSSTDESTVDVWLCKQLWSVACLAASTIEDGSVVGYFLAILVGNHAADVCVDLLCLVGSSGLACTDSPDWLVGNDDVFEFLCSEVEHASFEFSLHNLVLLVCLTLLKTLADAEDYLQTVFQRQEHFLLQYLWSIIVIASAL